MDRETQTRIKRHCVQYKETDFQLRCGLFLDRLSHHGSTVLPNNFLSLAPECCVHIVDVSWRVTEANQAHIMLALYATPLLVFLYSYLTLASAGRFARPTFPVSTGL